MGTLTIAAFLLVLGNILSDLIVAMVDPRVGSTNRLVLRLLGRLFWMGALLGAAGRFWPLSFQPSAFLSRSAEGRFWALIWREEQSFLGSVGWSPPFFCLGIFSEIAFARGFSFTPITLRRIERFKSIKRGYYSLIVILVLAAVASLDHILVGNEALVVQRDGEWHWPAFSRQLEKGEVFGLTGDDAQSPPDYRNLQRRFADAGEGDWVLLPILPYASTGDTVTAVSTGLEVSSDGFATVGGEPFSGLASRVYDLARPEGMHLRFRFRMVSRMVPQMDGTRSETAFTEPL